jgi:hypothetical protein
MKPTTLLILVVLSTSTVAFSEIAPEDNTARLRQIDRNNNGVLESDEVDLGLWYRANKGKVDLKMPPTVQQVAEASASNAVVQLLHYEFENAHGKKPSYQFTELDAEIDFKLPKVEKPKGDPSKKPVPKDGDLKSRFLLRRSLDKAPLVFDTDKSAETMKQGPDKFANEGALFSYGHSFKDGADEWLAQGVLAYEIPFEGSIFSDTAIGRGLFSIEFSRINFRGTGSVKSSSPRFKAEDNLAKFSGTYETLVNWPQGIVGFTGSSLRFNAGWKTDWDFQSHIPMGEVEWTFYNGSLGFGSFNTSNNYLWFRIAPAVHADAGYVLEDGRWTKSTKGDTFAHVGPKIGLSLMPLPKSSLFRSNPLLLSASFSEFLDVTKQAKEIRAFTADASWYLRKPGSGSIGPVDPGVALTLSYRDYLNAENQSDDNSILLGLAVGF